MSAIEFALIAPVMLTMIAGVIQFGAIFFVQNQIQGVAQDTSRRIAIGDLTALEAQSYAQDRLTNWGVTFTVTVTEPDDDAQVEITAPLAEVAILDPLGIFGGKTVRAGAVSRKF